jgi:hypothetical protein
VDNPLRGSNGGVNLTGCPGGTKSLSRKKVFPFPLSRGRG